MIVSLRLSIVECIRGRKINGFMGQVRGFVLVKSLVNKLFPWKRMYNLRMRDRDLVIKNMNAFNVVVSQLLYFDINISNEDKYICLLCSLLDPWDSLVFFIRSNETTLKFDEIISSFLSQKMTQKNIESLKIDTLFIRACSQNKNRNKSIVVFSSH